MFGTLPIPILLGLLAQAEPAPPEPTSPSWEAAPVNPVAQPREPGASQQKPEALPAPAPVPTPSPTTPPPTPGQATPGRESPFKVGFCAGADFQISGDVPPKVGFSFSPFFEYQAARLADRLGLGLRAEFVFDRFQQQVTAQVSVDGQSQPYQNNRSLSFYDFALLATATLHLGPLRPWVAGGAGLALGYFSTPETAYLPGDARTTRPIVAGAFGIDVAFERGVQIGLHGEYRGMLAQPDVLLDTGTRIRPFGDRFSLQAAVLYQF
jgi:hypothetical protein